VFITAQQTAILNGQQAISKDIQTRASNLQYVSNDYFLFQVDPDLTQWQTEFNALTSDILKLGATSPEQQKMVNNVKNDSQLLDNRWGDVVDYLQNANRNVSIRVLPVFQGIWSRMALQNQGLIFDSQQLSQSFQSQIDKLNSTSLILMFTLLGVFGAYFVTYYLITFRNTLNSISDLQSGIAAIGSGNLDHTLRNDKKDEIGEVSRSLNQMAANLKTVTASKIDLEHAQASLQESEQRWSTTLTSIGDAVIATDTLGKTTFMNAEAENLTGWKLIEASGLPVKSVFNIVNEQSRLEVENPIDKVLREGIVVGLANHTVLVRKDGTEVPIDDSGAPIRDKYGETTGVVLIFRDIAERKKTEEAMSRQAALIDLSPDAIIVRNIDGTITFWSKGAEKLYGWTKDEAVGQDIHSLLETECRRRPLKEVLDQLKLQGKWSGELIHTSKNGEKVAVQSYWLGKMGKDGQITEIFESNVDVTDRNRMQTKLEESAVQLEEYANQMEDLADQRAEQLKNAERLATIGATAGMVGHDIRNPLQAIIGDVFLAKAELDSIPDSYDIKNALESLQEIEKNVDYINKIVADLQDYAKNLKPVVKEVNVQNLLDELLAKNNVPEDVKVQVKVHKNADTVMADPDILKRILGNLVINAVQAMPNGGKLTIQTRKDSCGGVITVADTGVGIPEQAKEKLFTPLFTTKSKGQGFGLAVVKRMTEALGGTVTFESEEGKGTKFILNFPRKGNNGDQTH